MVPSVSFPFFKGEEIYLCAFIAYKFTFICVFVNLIGEVELSGDGEFEGFTVYKGHPYCETCHVRLRLPKCKRCKRSIRDHDEAVEALGGKWCWRCFVCAVSPSLFISFSVPFYLYLMMNIYLFFTFRLAMNLLKILLFSREIICLSVNSVLVLC